MSISWNDKPLSRRSVLAGLGVGSLTALAACTTGSPSKGDTPGSSGSSTSSKAKAAAATIAVSIPDAAADVAPVGLTVTATGGQLDAVALTRAAGQPVEGAIDAATATWKPTAPLEYGAKYTVIATASNPDGDATQVTSSFTTVEPAKQIFPGIGPLDGMVVGIAMPVRVYFDHAVTDRKTVEQNLAVTPTPAQPGGWNWISDTEVHWRPQEYWQAGTTVKVDVNIFGVNAGNGAWGKQNRSITFTTGKAQVAKCDTNEHQLHCYENGALVNSIPISAGKEEPGRYTKSGIHVVTDKKESMTMDSTTYGLALDAGGYQTDVKWATRISNNGEFVHAAPWSIGDQGVRNVSHGCLNASPANAKWFLQWSQVGDPVEITGSPVQLSMADGDIFDWTIDWPTWQAGSANK